jgi:NAD(P)H-dependent flavin oxidoreductase YrpB (nitropropane dioxygenase family)
MGWIANADLVAASGAAGAFPFLAVGTLSAEDADREIARVRELCDTPFGVNFLMDQPGVENIVESAVRYGASAAGYGRAPRAEVISTLKEAGLSCVATVGLPRHAEKAVELGADAVIAQGAEGGGHTGTVATSQLVPAVVATVDVPVVAAGGFADGRGLVAALALGAAGIAMGTRFLLTAESPAPDHVKHRYLDAGIADTVVTSRIDGMTQRVIRNELLDNLDAGDASPAGAAELARRTFVDGDVVNGSLPAGQVVGRIDDLPTCQVLVERIVAEAEDVLTRLGG